jgi:hypothetical protein
MAFNFKGAHFPPEVILMGVRWYVAYPLSTRHVEELINRLRVFRRAKVASLCSGGGPKRETRAVPSEKCVARWGREYDKMRMITTSFARVLARYTGHLYMPFS